MSLQEWQRAGHLTKHTTSRQEIQDLQQAALRDLVDCGVSGLSADWRFSIAYNAALRMATTALAASGYRASRNQHHFRVIHSLRFTVGAGADLVDLFDRFRKKRNIGAYERAGTISDQEAEEMLRLAEKVKHVVEEWVKREHPELV
jgi:hypothetical protein